MKKENLSASMPRLIMAVILIVCVGALLGVLGFFWTMPKSGVVDNRAEKEKIENYLPEGFEIVFDYADYNADVDNDGIEEKFILIKKTGGILEKLVILKPGYSGYEIVKIFELDANSGAFFGEFDIRDINNDKIPEIIFTINFGGSGETMPKEVNIVAWNGKEFQFILKKDMILYSYNRNDLANWNKKFIKDLNNNDNMEVIIPRSDSLYQAYCNYPTPGCVSLLKFDVYEWDGIKYIETTNEFISIYNEEVNLAEGFLNDPNIQKYSREKIEKYLKEINDLKEMVDWKIYRNEEINFTFKYPIDWEITQDYFYETLSGIKATKRTVNLKKIGEDGWISINQRQFLCDQGRCETIAGNEIATYNKESEILEVFDKIVKSFEMIDKTADWQTYRNEEYGFEVKYPKEWEKQERQGNDYGKEDLLKVEIKLSPHPQKSDFKIYSITIFDNDQKMDYKNICKFYNDSVHFQTIPECALDQNQVSKKNYTTLLNIDKVVIFKANFPHTYAFVAGFAKDNLLFEFIEYSGYENLDQPTKMFNQILSTFKFTEKDEVVN